MQDRLWRATSALAAIGISGVGLAGVPLAGRAASPTDDLLRRAGQYVQELEQQLAVVIADETYVQDVWTRSRPPSGTTRIITRTIKSEMLFMQLPREDVWLAVRNVVLVDGRPVADSRQRLERALAAPGLDVVSRLRALDEESARYDVGRVWRTTGYPSVVLRFLLPGYQTRFAFSPAGTDRLAGERVSRIKFTERGSPSVIQVNAADVTASGMIWLRPADGAVVRTALALTTPSSLNVSIVVDFQRDARLGLWVPSRMDERYDEISGDSTRCTARYSNFRRFETSGRMIVPQ